MKSLFDTAEFPALVARVFAKRPSGSIDDWARKNVFLTKSMAPKAGYYDPTVTPWTRRVQRLAQHPYHLGVRIRRIVIKKCSQSGFTEAILNCIRWFAKFSPRNVIYSINSKEEVGNITDRLKPTLEKLGEDIIPDNSDNMGKFKMKLLHMTLWFFGSYSSGSYANKQAPFTVADEVEEHAKLVGETATTENLESRGKRSEGLQIEISKPKLEGGPIDVGHKQGNGEIYFVACPLCGTYQELTQEGLAFSHCKNLLNDWDLEKVLRETYYKCQATFCGQPIHDHHKPQMVQEWPAVFVHAKKTWEYVSVEERERLLAAAKTDQERFAIGTARWFATGAVDIDTGLPAQPDPEIISQHMSDLYSDVITFGQLAKKIIATKGNPVKRMAVINHNFGLAWRQFASKTESSHILNRREAYKRGTIPFQPHIVLLGADVGLDYARWVVGAIGPENELAIVDWGVELHPEGVREIIRKRAWPEKNRPAKKHKIFAGGIDAKFRREDVYVACLKSLQRLWPVSGRGSNTSRESFSFNKMERADFPEWFGVISFNDRDFKSELYIDRIRTNEPRIMFPIDVDQQRPGESANFVQELCGDRLERNMRTGNLEWQRGSRPNHYGDCCKVLIVIWRYGTRERDEESETRETKDE